jgi:hypothetical protein
VYLLKEDLQKIYQGSMYNFDVSEEWLPDNDYLPHVPNYFLQPLLFCYQALIK